MSKLLKILKYQTESLRTQFINRVVEFETKAYEYAETRRGWDIYDYCKFLEITPTLEKEKAPKYVSHITVLPSGIMGTEKGKRLATLMSATINTERITKEKLIEKVTEQTQAYYEASINKLAFRLEQKYNFNLDNLKVTTSHIGVNIETTLTDGVQIVRAFTIIAEGEIQRPHYRYLIK